MLFNFKDSSPRNQRKTPLPTRQIEGREWWLWGFAVIVTLALTAGIVFLTFFGDHAETAAPYWADIKEWVRGLAAFVLLFDIYTMYQHLQLQGVRRQLAERDQLFQLITENAADMIAVVDGPGRRLYNSPAYQKVLGYSTEDLSGLFLAFGRLVGSENDNGFHKPEDSFPVSLRPHGFRGRSKIRNHR